MLPTQSATTRLVQRSHISATLFFRLRAAGLRVSIFSRIRSASFPTSKGFTKISPASRKGGFHGASHVGGSRWPEASAHPAGVTHRDNHHKTITGVSAFASRRSAHRSLL